MRFQSALFLCAILFATTASADLVFSAPPRETAAEAEALYKPLIDRLSKVLGEKVVFQIPENWAAYSHMMQEGQYDLVLDGPHFVAWRVSHKGHVPLVRLDGPLVYTILAKKEGPSSMQDLRARKICSMTSPNLTGVIVLNQFDQYAASAPELFSPRGGLKGSFEAFQKGKCDAVALPSYFFTQVLSADKTADYRTLFTSEAMPNLALTAGPKVPKEKRKELVAALTEPGAEEEMAGLLSKLAGTGKGTFIPASSKEYAGYEKLLEGVVWGW